jgi:hypothetical protein
MDSNMQTGLRFLGTATGQTMWRYIPGQGRFPIDMEIVDKRQTK